MPDGDNPAFDRVMMDLYAQGARDQEIPHLPHPITVKRIIVVADDWCRACDVLKVSNCLFVQSRLICVNSDRALERTRGLDRTATRYTAVENCRVPLYVLDHLRGYGYQRVSLENTKRWLTAVAMRRESTASG